MLVYMVYSVGVYGMYSVGAYWRSSLRYDTFSRYLASAEKHTMNYLAADLSYIVT